MSHVLSVLCMLFVVLCPSMAWAQSAIKGTVVDESGSPLIGATVVVVGTQNATSTNVDGQFSLSGVKVGSQLMVTFIGYTNQTVDVTTATNYNIVLKNDAEMIEDVVVVGYGVQKKASVTASISQISGKELEKAPMGDVTTWLDGENLYWQANTEKGEALTASVKELFVDSDKAAVEAQQEATKAIIDKLPFSNLNLERFKPENLNDLFNDPKWEEMSEACLGCGTCTFVCPTCQCFDIRDFKTNEGILRYRCWDSCMYSDFTLMAHGNSRTTQMQRFRQRFMHKLVYYPSQNDGLYSCVGCGRCVNKCPQSLNIVKVIKEVGGKEND